ncbi:hypothetical protein NPS52_16190 [Pseudomonas putida]|nr:hypothetical protein [Pseudomonas putida]MDD2152164.1 hypothetical protein [Pseudomonas putida]
MMLMVRHHDYYIAGARLERAVDYEYIVPVHSDPNKIVGVD